MELDMKFLNRWLFTDEATLHISDTENPHVTCELVPWLKFGVE
jgi:hypothetical protein